MALKPAPGQEDGVTRFSVEGPTPTTPPPKQPAKPRYKNMPSHHPTPPAMNPSGGYGGITYSYDDALAGKGITTGGSDEAGEND
jgi:hypothetical protein